MNIDRKYKPEIIASKDITREALCEPYFDKDASVIVATNGHCLVKVPVTSDPIDTEGQITTVALKQARKNRCDLSLGENVRLSTGEQYSRKTVNFPPWSGVIPEYRVGDKGTVSISLNASYLKNIADALGSKDSVVVLTLKNCSENDPDPIIVTVPNDKEAIGVLMPCRR